MGNYRKGFNKKKLKLIADKLSILLTKEQKDAFTKMHHVRNDLVHSKPYKVEEISGIIKNSCVENVSSRSLEKKSYKWHKYENDDVIRNIQTYIPELCRQLARKSKVPYTCGTSVSSNISEKTEME